MVFTNLTQKYSKSFIRTETFLRNPRLTTKKQLPKGPRAPLKMSKSRSERESRFLAIVAENDDLIRKVCYMYASDATHFQDLYQEVLANLWEGLESYRGEAKISTWLYRTAINTCVTYFRRYRRHATEMTGLDNAGSLAAATDDRPGMLKQMYDLIADLGPVDRAIILMWLDERSYDEIAEVTGFTRANVATRLRRIKLSLAKKNNE